MVEKLLFEDKLNSKITVHFSTKSKTLPCEDGVNQQKLRKRGTLQDDSSIIKRVRSHQRRGAKLENHIFSLPLSHIPFVKHSPKYVFNFDFKHFKLSSINNCKSIYHLKISIQVLFQVLSFDFSDFSAFMAGLY